MNKGIRKERGLYKRKGKDGKELPNWYYCFQVGGRLYRGSTGTSNKSLARERMSTIKSDLLRDESGIKAGKDFRFPDLVNRYLDATKDEKRSHHRDCEISKVLISHIGNRRLSEVLGDEMLIRRYMKARQAGEIEVDGKLWRPASKTTVNRDLALLKTMFNRGIEWGMCNKNPVKRGMINASAEEEAKKTVFLQRNEVNAYLDACQPYYKPVALTALLTGMRSSEIKELTWDRVDLINNTIYLEHTKGGRRREIRMPIELTNVLKKLESKKHGRHVFLNRHGQPYRDFREAHKWTLKRSGIEANRLKNFDNIADPEERRAAIKKNRITFHTLRHTFGTLLAKDCRDLNIVKEALGHANITTTERYAHVIEDAHRDAIQSFSKDLLHTNCTPANFGNKAERDESRKIAVNEVNLVDTPKWRNW